MTSPGFRAWRPRTLPPAASPPPLGCERLAGFGMRCFRCKASMRSTPEHCPSGSLRQVIRVLIAEGLMHLQAHPVHLWDAVTGELRCSYLGYDDKDEVTAAFSVAFSADGSQVCKSARMDQGAVLKSPLADILTEREMVLPPFQLSAAQCDGTQTPSFSLALQSYASRK